MTWEKGLALFVFITLLYMLLLWAAYWPLSRTLTRMLDKEPKEPT